ncbi:YbaB/EbfC family nucleoid-associated protein [Nocardia sp. NPDC055029]
MYETMDELEASVRRKLYRLRDLADDMAGVSATETSPDGAITATVDGNGTLVNLEFTQEISTMTPAEFEAGLTETAAIAVRRAFARRAELVTAFNEEAVE